MRTRCVLDESQRPNTTQPLTINDSFLADITAKNSSNLSGTTTTSFQAAIDLNSPHQNGIIVTIDQSSSTSLMYNDLNMDTSGTCQQQLHPITGLTQQRININENDHSFVLTMTVDNAFNKRYKQFRAYSSSVFRKQCVATLSVSRRTLRNYFYSRKKTQKPKYFKFLVSQRNCFHQH